MGSHRHWEARGENNRTRTLTEDEKCLLDQDSYIIVKHGASMARVQSAHTRFKSAKKVQISRFINATSLQGQKVILAEAQRLRGTQ